MKLFYIFIILILFQNCSFDNKSGIWKDENNILNDDSNDNDLFKEFETLSTSGKSFDKIIPIDNSFKFKKTTLVNNFEWKDVFYAEDNNFINFKYTNLNELIFRSKKTTKYKVNDFILFDKNNLITADLKGNIIVFSVNNNKIVTKFNFYKKKYKNIKKKLNFIVENNIIYISDNIGFLYAFDYKQNRILWAKNYKIPFRSNLKIYENKLIAANQNNNLYFFNKKNGDTLRLIPTEDTTVKNKFINNLSLNNNSLFFLNTYGSLYSVNLRSMKLKWFTNFNQSLDLNPSNLFLSNQIINNKGKIVVSSNQFTYVLDSNNGSIIHKKNFSTQIKPIIMNDILFLITNNNLIIAMSITSGKIIYSYDVNQMVANFLDVKKKKIEIKNIFFVNNKIMVLLKNSYVIYFNINGIIDDVFKLPSKINTNPIIINKTLLYFDFKNKLSVVD